MKTFTCLIELCLVLLFQTGLIHAACDDVPDDVKEAYLAAIQDAKDATQSKISTRLFCCGVGLGFGE